MPKCDLSIILWERVTNVNPGLTVFLCVLEMILKSKIEIWIVVHVRKTWQLDFVHIPTFSKSLLIIYHCRIWIRSCARRVVSLAQDGATQRVHRLTALRTARVRFHYTLYQPEPSGSNPPAQQNCTACWTSTAARTIVWCLETQDMVWVTLIVDFLNCFLQSFVKMLVISSRMCRWICFCCT